MPFLLMVFLVLVCLPDVKTWPEPLWTNSPSICVAVTWLTVLIGWLYASVAALRVCHSIKRDPNRRERLLARYERGRFRQQIGLFVLFLLTLLVFGWGWAVAQLWRWHAHTLPGAELLVLSPFVAAHLLAWSACYDAERAAHHLLASEPHVEDWLEPERTPADTSSPFDSRASFVLFQLRQKMALAFLPVLLLQFLKELQRFFPDAGQNWPKTFNVLGLLAVLTVFASLPWVVRLALGLKPLPAGPLRDRLEASARRLRFRCSNLLLWNTRHNMANAFVIGIVPWIRYVVFTDRLVEDFTPEEIEAVFGHEVGHVRHHHMLYYFSFLIASVVVLGWGITELAKDWPWGRLLETDETKYWSALPLVGILLSYIFVVFGFLSRRCERQADVFGCRAVSCPRPDCCGHEDDLAPTRGDSDLCPTGINTFIRALEKVAVVNGISRDRPGFLQSWQHSTIGRRVEFLRSILVDANLEKRFQRRVALVKWLLLLVLGGALALILARESNRPVKPPASGVDATRLSEPRS